MFSTDKRLLQPQMVLNFYLQRGFWEIEAMEAIFLSEASSYKRKYAFIKDVLIFASVTHVLTVFHQKTDQTYRQVEHEEIRFGHYLDGLFHSKNLFQCCTI